MQLGCLQKSGAAALAEHLQSWYGICNPTITQHIRHALNQEANMPNAEYELDLPLISLPKIANFSTAKLLEFCCATMVQWWLFVLAVGLVVWCLPIQH